MRNQKLYILRLSSGKFYIGISNDPWRRWLQHKKGTGSLICRVDPPKEQLHIIDLKTSTEWVAKLYEDFVVCQWVLVHGAKVVIGGAYVNKQYREASKEWWDAEYNRLLSLMQNSYQVSGVYPSIEELPNPIQIQP